MLKVHMIMKHGLHYLLQGWDAWAPDLWGRTVCKSHRTLCYRFLETSHEPHWNKWMHTNEEHNNTRISQSIHIQGWKLLDLFLILSKGSMMEFEISIFQPHYTILRYSRSTSALKFKYWWGNYILIFYIIIYETIKYCNDKYTHRCGHPHIFVSLKHTWVGTCSAPTHMHVCYHIQFLLHACNNNACYWFKYISHFYKASINYY